MVPKSDQHVKKYILEFKIAFELFSIVFSPVTFGSREQNMILLSNKNNYSGSPCSITCRIKFRPSVTQPCLLYISSFFPKLPQPIQLSESNHYSLPPSIFSSFPKYYVCVCAQSLIHIYLFYNTMDYSQPGSSIHWIFLARVPGLVVISSFIAPVVYLFSIM